MKKLRIVCLILTAWQLGLGSKAQSLEAKWRVGFDYFFDNTEFESSTLTDDRTMSAVRLSPEAEFSWSGKHHLFAGFSALRNTGSRSFADHVTPLAYYLFKEANVQLYAGIFPRNELLSNYSDFFFQDSVRYYVPAMQGIFWQMGKRDDSFFNLWLDWTGKQSPVQHESFFLGASAYKKFNLFFLDFQSYLFHFAKTLPPNDGQHVCDNALLQLSAGLKWNKLSVFDDVILSAGGLAGFERERNVEGQTYMPIGLVLRAKADFWKLSVDNRLYLGDKRMNMYGKFGSALYWGNPFLRDNLYFQSRLYWQIFQTDVLKARLASHFHYSEAQWMFEQVFTLQVAIGN
ncbi:MAG: hypothetical protein LBS07_01030 [Prevotellaceae bacterium]|jgi:hypothetical protein|nr:hypothetical protein [Prevotellaceae bacterium]